MADNLNLPKGAELIETKTSINLPKGATLIENIIPKRTENLLQDYSSGLLSGSFDTKNQVSLLSAQNDTSGIRPNLYKLPTVEKVSEVENIIKDIYTPDFLKTSVSEDQNMSISRAFQQRDADNKAQDKINFLKAKTNDEGVPITKQEKDAAVKELLDLQDTKLQNSKNNLDGIRGTYLTLLNQARDSYASPEDINNLSNTYQALNKKYSYDSQLADKQQKELKNLLPEIVEIPDQFSEAAKNDIKYLDQFSDEELKKSFGELGIDKSYISKINDTDNAEAAKIAYNTKPKNHDDVYSLDSPSPFHSELTQTKGNPKWVNEMFQKQGGYQVISNFQDLFNKEKEQYNQISEEYTNKITEYNQNPSEESYKELENYKNQILNPTKDKLEKRQTDLQRLYRIQESSYKSLDEWQNKQKEQENLDLSTLEGQLVAGYRSLSNKNAHIFVGLEQPLNAAERFIIPENEFIANRIAAQNRIKSLTYTVPEKYHTTPVLEDFDSKNPKSILERVNWSNLVAKNLETTAFSLEIAGVTALTGGGVNAILPVTFAMTYGDNLYNAKENGLNESQASAISAFQSLVEGTTERISPLEAKIFNPNSYTTGALKQLTKKEIIQQLYREITKKEINQSALEALVTITGNSGKKLSKAALTGAYTVIQETAEELAGDFLNGFINVTASNNIQGYTYEPITLESLKNTAITSASTMALMGLWGGGSELFNPQVSSYNLDLAKNPNLYLESLQYSLDNNQLPDFNLKNGITMTKSEFYDKAKKNIENLSSIYKTNQQVIDNLDEKYQQANYIGLINGQNSVLSDISKFVMLGANLTPKQEKQIETLQTRLNEYQTEIQKYNNMAFENISLSQEDRERNQESKVFESTSKQFTDNYINTIIFPEQIRAIQSNLFERYTYSPSERMKTLTSELNTKLSNRLQEVENKPTSELIEEVIPKPELIKEELDTENIDLITQEKEKYNNLTSEQLEEEKANLLSREDLTDEQQEELYNDISNRLEGLEQQSTQVVFGDKQLEKNQFVKVEGQTGLWQVVDNVDGTLRVQIPGEISSTINVSDPNDITIVSDEEKNQYFSERNITQPNDKEAKRADIEKRRQDELNPARISWNIIQASTKEQVKQKLNELLESTKKSLENRLKKEKTETRDRENKKNEEDIIKLEKLLEYVSSNEINNFDELFDYNFDNSFTELNKFLNTHFSQQYNSKREQQFDEINAKYDAELASLENPSNTKSKEELIAEKKEVDEKIKDIVINDAPTTSSEFRKLGLRQKELESLLGEQVEQSKEEQKDINVEVEQNVEKGERKLNRVFYPFSTQPQQLTQTGLLDEPIVNAQVNTFAKIKEQLLEGKTYSDLGYYITVMNPSFPISNRFFNSTVLGAYNEGRLTEERIKAGRIAVITDENGDIIYFNQEGNVSNSTEGFPVYQNLRGKLENGELVMNKAQEPSKEDLEKSGETEQYNSDLQVLKSVRESKEPMTFEVLEITPGFEKKEFSTAAINTLGEIKLSPYGINQVAVIDSTGAKYYSIPSSLLKDTNLLADVEALLDMNNKEGLSEPLQNSWEQRRNYLEKFLYTYGKSKSGTGDARRFLFDNKENKLYLSDTAIGEIQLNIDYKLLNKPFTYYKFEDGKFTANTRPYNDFIAEQYKIRKGESKIVDSYIKLGSPVFPEINTEPVVVQVENPIIQQEEESPIIVTEFKKSNRSRDIKVDPNAKGLAGLSSKTELKRSKVLRSQVTQEQDNIAKKWFEDYISKSPTEFQDLRNIVNSDAYATWSTAAIKLWNSGKYSDLYHEAFHDFSQLYLTKAQKKSLYDEVAKTDKGRKAILGITDENQRFFILEELLAEDFYNYMLSGQKLILNNRIKRNSIFRKMYNFLKELFTGKPNLQTIYENLANQNISKYNYNVKNALFGQLNKNIEGLNLNDSINLYRALDSLIAKLFRDSSISISRLFKDPKAIDAVYNDVFSTLKYNLDSLEEEYNDLVDKYNSASTLEKQNLLPDITSLKRTVDNIARTLENWNNVKLKHLTESDFLKISKQYISEEIIDELSPETKDSIYDDKESESQKDRASNQLIYLIGSLNKYINQDGKKVIKKNDFIDIIDDITEFDTAWNLLAKTLTGTRDYSSMWKKINDLAKTNPEYKDLIKSLPAPENTDIDLLTMQLRNQFINVFSQPLVPLKIANLWKDEEGKINTSVKVGSTKAIDNILNDWKNNIQEVENPYTELDKDTGQYYYNVSKLIDSFPKKIQGLTNKRKSEFLDALGFTFSPQTIESAEYQDLLNNSGKLQQIYNSLLQYQKLLKGEYPKGYIPTNIDIDFINKPVTSPLDIITKTLYGTDRNYKSNNNDKNPVLIYGQQENIQEIAQIELTYSDKFFSDNIMNSEGSSVWAIRPWSQQTVLYNYLNNVEKFPTYNDLIQDPIGGYFDITKNPDADNIYLNAAFNLSTGKRKLDKKGKPVQIKLYNHNGLSISIKDELPSGNKTINLSRFEKLIQDISPLLKFGNKEHIRYGDKTTSNGTETYFDRLNEDSGSNNLYLPVDVNDFRDTILPVEAESIMLKALNSALKRTNKFNSGIGKNWDNYKQNLDKKEFWGYFDGILSEDTKKSILDAGLLDENASIRTIINSHKAEIKKDLTRFFTEDVNKIKSELSDNKLINPEDYLDEYQLKNYGFETIVRAFGVNSYIMNMEHTRLMFQDPRFYDNKKGSYKEPFKRYAKASSTGTVGINDGQLNEWLSKPENSRVERLTYNKLNPANQAPEWVENGIENSVIFNDVQITAEDFIDKVESIFKNSPIEEQLEIRKAYSGITTTDAFGFCTFDWYRIWNIKTGNDDWNNEKESLYKKIARGEKLSQAEEQSSFAFFPPLKIRQVGYVFDNETSNYIPVDYKFAVSPLLPTVVNNKAFATVKNNMLRQNVSIGLFKSASKHSSITNNEGSHNKFYNADGTINTEDYTTNPIFTEFIFEVVASPSDYKKEVSFSTQLRKLLFVNSFEGGIPVDYKKANWFDLSEQEKLKASSIYKAEQEFGNTIANLVSIEKDRLVKQLGAKLLSNGNYQIDEEKFSQMLEREFKNRNLSYNVLKSVETVNGKFKYPLDASLQREAIEQIVLSIIDNRLRKQKGLGEGLIQASSIGYENIDFKRAESWNSIDGNDLPFYGYEKGTRNGKRVTSAQKVKIALQGDFKKLLNLQEVQELAYNDKITTLEALNRLIKTDEFLDKKGIREAISISAVRIPVQGINSMEFMEVYDFLPEEAGSVIIVSPALVAKSGSDFDWDKLTTLFNSFRVNKGQIEEFKAPESDKINQLYKSLSKEYKEALKTNSDEATDKLISRIFNIPIEELSNIESEEAIKEDFNSFNAKQFYNNKLNSIIRETLERLDVYEQLVTPNSTYMFEPIADERLAAQSSKKPKYSDIPSVTESLNQFESNTVGKATLGIGAIWNTLFSQMQKAGVYLNTEYKNNLTNKNFRKVNNRLAHNTTKNGNVSLSGIYSQEYKGTKYRISEAISQLMNGWVDVAKKDWVFYINGKKEIAPVMLFAATTGIHKDVLIGFFNQPVLYDFVQAQQRYKSNIVKLKDKELAKNSKLSAIIETIAKYAQGNDLMTELYQELQTAYENNNTFAIYKVLNEKLRDFANMDNNKKLFNPDYFMKFSIPQEGKLETPKTNEDKLAQILHLVQFLEFQEQQGIVDKLRRSATQDTQKPINLQYSKERQVNRAELAGYGLFSKEIIDRFSNESVIKAFTDSKTGIDKFIQKLTDKTFEVTNHPVFNRFLYEEFQKPTEESNIPFEIKFDIYEDWVKAVKNDFILYLYQNYVYTPNTTDKVANTVFQQMKYNTALALELESIKRNFPELVQNNKLLQFLVRDNSRQKLGGKPKLVNLKLKQERLDNTTSNLLTEAFEDLLQNPNPQIKAFADKLPYFSFIQSGLTKSPISFSNIIPQEKYGEDMGDIIRAFSDVMDTNPEKARSALDRFYNSYFKPYNRKFFVSNQVFDEATNTYVDDVDFTTESFRQKNYIDNRAIDILDKKKNIEVRKEEEFKQSLKTKSTTDLSDWTENTAKENPTKFYIYSSNETNGGKIGDAKVKGDIKNPYTNTAPIIVMKQGRAEGGNWTDKTYNSNINMIDKSIDETVAKIRQLNPTEILFPKDGLDSIAKLKEFAPRSFEYLQTRLNQVFGYSEINTNLEPEWIDNESPVVNQREVVNYPIVVTKNSKGEYNIWAGSNENSILSNLAIRPFNFQGDTFNSVEEFFQLQKMNYLKENLYTDGNEKELQKVIENNNKVADEIVKNENNPFKIKQLGRKFIGLDIKAWDKAATVEMEKAVRASFEQNPKDLTNLLSTIGTTLTHTQDSGRWKLDFPKILTKVRQELNNLNIQEFGSEDPLQNC